MTHTLSVLTDLSGPCMILAGTVMPSTCGVKRQPVTA
jgi:hypothetical protein